MNPDAPLPLPTTRLRRLRHLPSVRAIVREVKLSAEKLILPLFICSGKDICKPIESMPGHSQLSVNLLAEELKKVADLGIGGVMLFGSPPAKDARGSDSLSDDGVIQQALRIVKESTPELLAITDVCFCEYTDHGHCGVLTEKGGQLDIDNDATLELLGRQAVSHVRAGSDLVAPSGMMDGMVGAIRESLDRADYQHIPIMSYAAKYASSFYGNVPIINTFPS